MSIIPCYWRDMGKLIDILVPYSYALTFNQFITASGIPPLYMSNTGALVQFPGTFIVKFNLSFTINRSSIDLDGNVVDVSLTILGRKCGTYSYIIGSEDLHVNICDTILSYVGRNTELSFKIDIHGVDNRLKNLINTSNCNAVIFKYVNQ